MQNAGELSSTSRESRARVCAQGPWRKFYRAPLLMKTTLYEKVMSKEKIEELEGKCTGNIEEGEEIKLKIVPLNKLAETCPDMKTLTALYLYRRIQINRNRGDIIREMEDETLRLKPLPNKL